MSRHSEGVRIVLWKAVSLNQELRVMQMPPYIRIGYFAVGQDEDQREDDERQHGLEGNKQAHSGCLRGVGIRNRLGWISICLTHRLTASRDAAE